MKEPIASSGATAAVVDTYDNRDDGYQDFLESIEGNFINSLRTGQQPIFRTDAAGLFTAFLEKLPEEARQHYTCRACQSFVERFGGMVSIKEDGTISSVVWNVETAPDFFKPSVEAILKIVNGSKVVGVSFVHENILGTKQSRKSVGENKEDIVFNHMNIDLRNVMAADSPAWDIDSNILRIKSGNEDKAFQKAAEKLQDFVTVRNAIIEYKPEVVNAAVHILTNGAVKRSEKFTGPAKWIQDLQTKRDSTKNRNLKDNFIWRAIALAPNDFCHIKAGVIGSLLDDIQNGVSAEVAIERFDKKLDPLKYQRAQVDPTEGNVKTAEKIIAELGAQNSLKRRYAFINEVPKIWEPKAPVASEKKDEGVFGHLKTKDAEPKSAAEDITVDGGKLTWEKFAEKVLPTALEIEVLLSSNSKYPIAGILTAADMDAPPILKWDNPEQRNPFSGYAYVKGTQVNIWNLKSGWNKTVGIIKQPNQFYSEDFNHLGEGVILLLAGAKDMNKGSLGLFPEILKSEFHEIRATIESYSQNGHPEGFDEEGHAIGYSIGPATNHDIQVRVKQQTGNVTYIIDRW